MRTFFLTMLMVVGCLVNSNAQNTAISTDAVGIVNAFISSIADKKSSDLQRLVTHDFNIVSWDGQTVDTQLLTQGLQEGVINLQNSATFAVRSRSYGDASIVTGTWRIKGDIQGTQFDNNILFTGVVVKQGGIAKIASFQMTPIH